MISTGATHVPLWTKSYALTVLALFIVFIPWALFLPVLPLYILQEIHGSSAAAGAANAVFLIAMVLFRAQTDRFESMYGKRNVLFAGGLLFTCSSLLYLTTRATNTILIIRFFSGGFFAVTNTGLMALGGQLAPLKRKGEGLAYLATAVTAATAVGPFAGLSLAKKYGFSWVFLFCAFITLLGAFITLCIDYPDNKPNDQSRARSFALQDLFEVRALPASIIILLLMFAISAVFSFASVYANGMHLAAASTYFFVVLALCAICSRLVAGRIYDRLGANFAVYPAILLLSLGLFILGGSTASFGMFASSALIGFAYGISVPSLLALAFKHSPPQRISVVTATYFTLFDLGMGAGSYLVGACLPLLGYANLYMLLSPLVLSAALIYYAICGGKRAYSNT